jgi:hypothetical protein
MLKSSPRAAVTVPKWVLGAQTSRTYWPTVIFKIASPVQPYNGGSGVLIKDLSLGFFGPGGNVTGNLGGTDVVCALQFPGARGALKNIGGGTTNCVEP